MGGWMWSDGYKEAKNIDEARQAKKEKTGMDTNWDMARNGRLEMCNTDRRKNLL
jgi:hypothetical protein